MATTTKLMTAEELLEMPDDGFRYELVRGELIKMAPAGHMPAFYELRIGARLLVFVEANGLGRAYSASGGFRLETTQTRCLRQMPHSCVRSAWRQLAMGTASSQAPPTLLSR